MHSPFRVFFGSPCISDALMPRLGGADICDVDSGRTTAADDAGAVRSVYVSATRDGSVWLRAGPDHTSPDWNYVDEQRRRFHAVILSADDIRTLKVVCSLRLTRSAQFFHFVLSVNIKKYKYQHKNSVQETTVINNVACACNT